jgi:transposase
LYKRRKNDIIKKGEKMPQRYQISEEQVAEIERARKRNRDKNVEKRLKALLLHAQGKKRETIAEQTGFVKSYISELVSKYCNKGLSSIVENNYHGNHRNISFLEEEAMLEPFKREAAAGQIIETSEIKRAYEKAIGRSLDNNHGQIYYVLHRHGWRKVMPRSKHPNKASEEVIEASKKLTLRSKRNRTDVWESESV